jgi:hypothetical protein
MQRKYLIPLVAATALLMAFLLGSGLHNGIPRPFGVSNSVSSAADTIQKPGHSTVADTIQKPAHGSLASGISRPFHSPVADDIQKPGHDSGALANGITRPLGSPVQ